MLIPVIVGLGLVSLFKGPAKKPLNYGLMTDERKHLYQSALNSHQLTADQYENLATTFEENGLPAEALLLRKRASLRAMPEEVRAKRKAIIRQLLAMNDRPEEIERMAAILDQQGASGSAKTLRIHAIGVRNAMKVKPVTVAPAPAPAPAPTEEGREANATTDDNSSISTPPTELNPLVDDEDLNDAGERKMTEAELTNPNLQ